MRLSFGFGKPFAAIVLFSALVASGCQTFSVNRTRVSEADARTTAPAYLWAIPIVREGLPNFYWVSDDLYRGGQPTAEGFRQAKALGVKTVINLRTIDDDREELARLGLDYEQIPMNPWHADDKAVARFLEVISDKSRAPFFLHCYFGSDRTGMMIAFYRINVQGWTKDEAIAEMTQGGFGFHGIWENLVDYVRNSPAKETATSALGPTPEFR